MTVKALNTAFAVASLAAQSAMMVPDCEAQPTKTAPAKATVVTSGTIGLQNVAGVVITFRLDDSSCMRQTPTWFECRIDFSGIGPTIVGPNNTPVSFTPQFAQKVKARGSGFVESTFQVTDVTKTLLTIAVGLPLGWAKASKLGPTWWCEAEYIVFGTMK